jgi:hypothetical protein
MNKKFSHCSLRQCPCPTCQNHPRSALAREHRWINRLMAFANERSRRLLAGFLATKAGRGGVSLLARITGLDRKTIAKGRKELRRGKHRGTNRLRRRGGGRKRVEIHNPGS